MTDLRRDRSSWLVLLGVLCLAAASAAVGQGPSSRPSPAGTEAAWLQWGGPARNFVVPASGLATSWPAEGPRRLWSRPLGDGHSSIVVDGRRAFTMYRPASAGSPGRWAREEVVVALDAGSGATLWEHRYPAAPLDFQFGAGPHSTPLVVGDRLFAAGTNKQIFALDKSTGRVLWSHDLVAEYGAPPTLIRPAVKAGYACSPLAYRDTVIVTAGGPGQAVMAFDQRDGSLVWKSQDFLIAPASPILISLDGEEQLVVLGGRDVNGLDPATGRLLWSHPHDTRGDMNISTPVWSEDGLLFVSSAYDGGSRMLRLSRDGGRTRVEELWFTRRLRVHIGTVIRAGDYVYGSSGDFGPAFITAVHVATGEVAWQDRRFARATFLYAGGRLIVLDEDGTLALATVSPAGLEVLAEAEVLTNKAWTAPTLVGTDLYLRDRRSILKLDLGPPS